MLTTWTNLVAGRGADANARLWECIAIVGHCSRCIAMLIQMFWTFEPANPHSSS